MDVGTKARPRDWLAATILAAGLILIFIPYAMGMMTIWTLASGVFMAVIGAYEVPHIFSDTQVAEGAATVATALAAGAAIAEAQHKKALEEAKARDAKFGTVIVTPPPAEPPAPRVQGGFGATTRAQADLTPQPSATITNTTVRGYAPRGGKKTLDRHVASPYAPTSEHTSDDA